MTAWKSAQGKLLQRSQPLMLQLVRAAQLIDVPMLARVLGFTDVPEYAERAPLRSATRLQLIGLAILVVLVMLITLVAVVSVEISSFSPSGWFGARSSRDSAPKATSVLRHENIVQRPLFSRSRQAVAVSAPPPQLAPPSPPRDHAITLKGIYINGGSAKAFLVSQQVPMGIWVETGQEIAGWRIATIRPGQVELEAQNERLAILLGIRNDGK